MMPLFAGERLAFFDGRHVLPATRIVEDGCDSTLVEAKSIVATGSFAAVFAEQPALKGWFDVDRGRKINPALDRKIFWLQLGVVWNIERLFGDAAYAQVRLCIS